MKYKLYRRLVFLFISFMYKKFHIYQISLNYYYYIFIYIIYILYILNMFNYTITLIVVFYDSYIPTYTSKYVSELFIFEVMAF